MARFACGWLKLYRSLAEHPAASDIESLGLFTWLLLHANRDHSSCKFGNELIDVHPGQLVTGRKEIAKALKCSDSKIERRLKWLEKCGSIEQRSNNHGRVITVLNWPKYQSREEGREQPANSERTMNEQPSNSERTLNGEEKKERREERYLTSESHDSGLPSPRDLAELWNTLKAPTQRAVNQKTFKPTSKRWTWAKARLAEHPDLAYWREVVERIATSSFCRGDGGTAWTADFDFLVRRDTHLKTMEGKYDDRAGNGSESDSEAYWNEFERQVREKEAKDAAKAGGL